MKYTPDDLKNAWNANRGEMLACESLDVKGRRDLAKQALQRIPDLARWVAAIKRAAESDFCTGKVEGQDGRSPFLASFDWLLRWETIVLIEEGQFDHRGPKPVIPPDSPSPQKDSSYWDGPRPVFGKFSKEVTEALERAGQRILAMERKTKVKMLAAGQMRIIGEELATGTGEELATGTPAAAEPEPPAKKIETDPLPEYVGEEYGQGDLFLEEQET